MMKKQKKLLIQRGIFLFIIFVSLGVIVVTEKASSFMIPRIQKKINTYINNNYNDLKETITTNDLKYNNSKYTLKITDKNNKYHYFYIYYQNKKIKDTYKNDYLEGKPLLNHIKEILEQEILNKTNTNTNISIITTLNNYTSITQERIIKEDNLLELKFYNLEKEELISNWNSKEITNILIETIKKYQDNNITPKYYNITITNKENIKESIKINNLDESFINNKDNILIIEDILKDNEKSNILKKYNITYKYR